LPEAHHILIATAAIAACVAACAGVCTFKVKAVHAERFRHICSSVTLMHSMQNLLHAPPLIIRGRRRPQLRHGILPRETLGALLAVLLVALF
jgi:hypothetical protein